MDKLKSLSSYRLQATELRICFLSSFFRYICNNQSDLNSCRTNRPISVMSYPKMKLATFQKFLKTKQSYEVSVASYFTWCSCTSSAMLCLCLVSLTWYNEHFHCCRFLLFHPIQVCSILHFSISKHQGACTGILAIQEDHHMSTSNWFTVYQYLWTAFLYEFTFPWCGKESDQMFKQRRDSWRKGLFLWTEFSVAYGAAFELETVLTLDRTMFWLA